MLDLRLLPELALALADLEAHIGFVKSGALNAAALYPFLHFFAGLAGRAGIPDDCNFGAAMVPATTSLRDPQVLLMLVASAIAGVLVSFAAAVWVKRRRPKPVPLLP